MSCMQERGLCRDCSGKRARILPDFYKAIVPLPNRQEIVALLENNHPFHYQYAFAPAHPLALLDKAEQMNMIWLQNDDKELKHLHIKSVFYQYVYELLRQMHVQEIHPVKPDIVAEAVRYMEEHAHQPLTLDIIAQELGCSIGYLSKRFKEKCIRVLFTTWVKCV